MQSLGMKLVLHSSLLLFLFSYSPKKTQSSNLTVHFQPYYLKYFVQLDLLGGQHNQSLSLGLDTRRGLTWTQTCKKTGSPYSPIRCEETECFEFRAELLNTTSLTCAPNSTCDYQLPEYEYNETLSKVNLTGFPDFVLGCGEGAELILRDGIDGVLGLGRGVLSFLPQTNNTRFSYCLPSSSNSTGYLTFNTHDNNDALLSFTHFARPISSSNYFVDIVAITVGGTQLPIAYQNITGTIIDTRSMFTRLPPAAYDMMRDEFMKQMGRNTTAYWIFDTCYNTTNLDSITPPPMFFTFKDNVKVDLDVSGILYVVNSTLSCFAFTNASDPIDFVTFASAQQRTLEMVFDVANNKLGFRQHGCA